MIKTNNTKGEIVHKGEKNYNHKHTTNENRKHADDDCSNQGR